MIRRKLFITVLTFVGAFFLTSAGLRIPLLDKTPGPKPKPRAVLNLFSKTASCSEISSPPQNPSVIAAPPEKHILPHVSLPVNCRYSSRSTSVSPLAFYLRRVNDRSPPSC